MSEEDETFSRQGRIKARITDEENFALAKWFTEGLEVPEDEATRKFFLAANERDVVKWSQMYGVKLVAMLADRGYMEPGQSPVDALLNVLIDFEELQKEQNR